MTEEASKKVWKNHSTHVSTVGEMKAYMAACEQRDKLIEQGYEQEVSVKIRRRSDGTFVVKTCKPL